MMQAFKTAGMIALGIALGMSLFQFFDFLLQAYLLMKKLGMQ